MCCPGRLHAEPAESRRRERRAPGGAAVDAADERARFEDDAAAPRVGEKALVGVALRDAPPRQGRRDEARRLDERLHGRGPPLLPQHGHGRVVLGTAISLNRGLRTRARHRCCEFCQFCLFCRFCPFCPLRGPGDHRSSSSIPPILPILPIPPILARRGLRTRARDRRVPHLVSTRFKTVS